MIRSEPRVLPYPECPWAADSARRLEGMNVADLPALVKEQFTGTSTCTHLNDPIGAACAALPGMPVGRRQRTPARRHERGRSPRPGEGTVHRHVHVHPPQ